MSTSLTLVSSIFKPRTRSNASATVLFIFQLPAIISLRSLFIIVLCAFALSRPLRKCSHTRHDLSFQEFQAGAAAGAHEGDLVSELGFIQGFHAIAAADDALRA